MTPSRRLAPPNPAPLLPALLAPHSPSAVARRPMATSSDACPCAISLWPMRMHLRPPTPAGPWRPPPMRAPALPPSSPCRCASSLRHMEFYGWRSRSRVLVRSQR
jgi:hypothetical protein